VFKTFLGVLNALFKLFSIYPDVIFGKGGYASFPTLFAARILRIPVVIHESDSAPGRVNAWAGKFADRIATSYKESADFFS
jgi:UDP-N-acetylglucosamine--N-acetylmuramyl-(pentapeptide) pyrophosphoryl-undecaprenol N-acetylglucosamine transferase